jgi:hypothetical protein
MNDICGADNSWFNSMTVISRRQHWIAYCLVNEFNNFVTETHNLKRLWNLHWLLALNRLYKIYLLIFLSPQKIRHNAKRSMLFPSPVPSNVCEKVKLHSVGNISDPISTSVHLPGYWLSSGLFNGHLEFELNTTKYPPCQLHLHFGRCDATMQSLSKRSFVFNSSNKFTRHSNEVTTLTLIHSRFQSSFFLEGVMRQHLMTCRI